MNRLGLVIGLAMWTGVAIAAGPVLGPGSAWTSVTVPPPIGIAIPTAKPGAGDPLGYADDAHPFGMQLAFHDEFEGTSLNKSTWVNTYNWGDRTLVGSGGQECYLEKNVEVSGGFLVLKAIKESTYCRNPDASTVFPNSMSIDYIRVYD